jgi:hypothetical protein
MLGKSMSQSMIELLLNAKAEVLAANGSGYTVLHCVVAHTGVRGRYKLPDARRYLSHDDHGSHDSVAQTIQLFLDRGATPCLSSKNQVGFLHRDSNPLIQRGFSPESMASVQRLDEVRSTFSTHPPNMPTVGPVAESEIGHHRAIRIRRRLNPGRHCRCVTGRAHAPRGGITV